jgi:hypothetical protein
VTNLFYKNANIYYRSSLSFHGVVFGAKWMEWIMGEKGWIESARVAVPDGSTLAFQKGKLSRAVTALKAAGEKAHVTLYLTKG